MGMMTIIGATKKKNTKTQMMRKLQCQMCWEGVAYCGNAMTSPQLHAAGAGEPLIQRIKHGNTGQQQHGQPW